MSHLNLHCAGYAPTEERAVKFSHCFAALHININQTGNVPLCIPSVFAPATPLLPRPRDTPLHISKYCYSIMTHLGLHCAGYASTEEREVWLCRVYHYTTFHSKPHIHHKVKARELLPLRSSRTLAIQKKIKKTAKEALGFSLSRPFSPTGSLDKNLHSLIATLPPSSIFIGSTLTKSSPEAKKAVLFYFSFFFLFFLSLSFFQNY